MAELTPFFLLSNGPSGNRKRIMRSFPLIILTKLIALIYHFSK